MKINALPSQARLLELLDYDPITGVLRWKIRRGMARAGSIAGHRDKRRLRVYVDDKPYAAHNLIWKMVTGKDPILLIDHEDCDCFNNRWGNLRESDFTGNAGNRKRTVNHQVGLKGVRPHRRRFQSFCAGKYLGTFQTAEEAHAVYVVAAKQYFGPFARA